jgi:hypothetical protein
VVLAELAAAGMVRHNRLVLLVQELLILVAVVVAVLGTQMASL